MVEVVICSHRGSLYILIGAKLHLLACLTHLVSDKILDRTAVDRDVLNLVERLGRSKQGCLEYLLSQSAERFIVSHKVSLALQSHDSGKTLFGTREHATLGSLAVLALGGYSLTLLTYDFDSCLDIALGFSQSVFAVHHACAGHFAQLLDIFY